MFHVIVELSVSFDHQSIFLEIIDFNVEHHSTLNCELELHMSLLLL